MADVRSGMVDLRSDTVSRHGVLGLPFGPTILRLVTHGDVDDQGIERAVEALHRIPEPSARK